jgi:hypothetical protein
MDSRKELEMFDQLSRSTRLKEWLQDKLESEYEVLCMMNDIEQVRRSQGRTQLLKSMLYIMEKARTTSK